jgi:hypothetical protein
MNTFPCPGDPLVTCTETTGTWLPLIITGFVFAAWLGYRFGRYGGGRRHRSVD